MVKSTLKRGVYGRVRVIEGFRNMARLYVKRTNLRTYVVSVSPHLALDSIVQFDGEAHFSTLRELHAVLNRPGLKANVWPDGQLKPTQL